MENEKNLDAAAGETESEAFVAFRCPESMKRKIKKLSLNEVYGGNVSAFIKDVVNFYLESQEDSDG